MRELSEDRRKKDIAELVGLRDSGKHLKLTAEQCTAETNKMHAQVKSLTIKVYLLGERQ